MSRATTGDTGLVINVLLCADPERPIPVEAIAARAKLPAKAAGRVLSRKAELGEISRVYDRGRYRYWISEEQREKFPRVAEPAQSDVVAFSPGALAIANLVTSISSPPPQARRYGPGHLPKPEQAGLSIAVASIPAKIRFLSDLAERPGFSGLSVVAEMLADYRQSLKIYQRLEDEAT